MIGWAELGWLVLAGILGAIIGIGFSRLRKRFKRSQESQKHLR